MVPQSNGAGFDHAAPAGPDWFLSERPASPEKKKRFEEPAIPRPSHIGRYVVLDYLGRGGMGIVYKAQHPISQQKVALKVIIPHLASKLAVEDFLQEIQVLARFSHRGVARIFDADTFESDGISHPYFTMELIEGAKPVTAYARDGRCDYRRRLELILQTASAVAQAHRVTVLHGDIKPSNVLVGLDGEVKVVDFGAAIDTSDPAASMRAMTPKYAAPEQRNERRAIPQSDVYSLAVLACEVLTGRLPFEDPKAPQPPGHLGVNSPARVPIPIRKLNNTVGRKVEKVLLHALSQQPEQRYADAEAFRLDLESAVRGGLLSIEQKTLWNRTRAFCAENRGPVLAISMIFAVLLMGIAGTTWQAVNASHKATEARRSQERAEQATVHEREARSLNEALLKRDRRALSFLRQVLIAPDTVSQKALAGEDDRIKAVALTTLGRIASLRNQFERSAEQLRQAVELWKKLAADPTYGPEEQSNALRERAAALDFLAWAELGDTRQTTGRTDRAVRAEQMAREAFRISRELDGASADDTLCFQADWLRMLQLAGSNHLAGINFMNLLAAAAGQELKQFLETLRQAVKETAELAITGNDQAARRRAREFLAPFIAKERPRFQARVPWSLAQLAEELESAPREVNFMTGLKAEHIPAMRLCLAELASELGKELLSPDNDQQMKVRDAISRIKDSHRRTK